MRVGRRLDTIWDGWIAIGEEGETSGMTGVDDDQRSLRRSLSV